MYKSTASGEFPLPKYPEGELPEASQKFSGGGGGGGVRVKVESGKGVRREGSGHETYWVGWRRSRKLLERANNLVLVCLQQNFARDERIPLSDASQFVPRE